MWNKHPKRYVLIFLFMGLVAALATSPILSQSDTRSYAGPKPTTPAQQGGGNGNGGGNGGNHGNGNGGGNGNHDSNGGGNGNSQSPDQGSQAQSTPKPTQAPSTTTQLGCQKNNPGRLDCSSLEVRGVCQGNVAVFTITNTGSAGDGDMRAPTEYHIYQDGSLVQTGTVQLQGGTSTQITYSSSGAIMLQADQQVGHPGKSEPRVALDCGGTPTQAPTEEVTPEPTTEVAPPDLHVDILCRDDGTTVFIVTNDGGAMPEPANYVVTDPSNTVLDSGSLQLGAGESTTIQVVGIGMLTMGIDSYALTLSGECSAPTPEPTAEVSPEPTTEVTPPNLSFTADCTADGAIFSIINNGGDMTDLSAYTVTDGTSIILTSGSFQLVAGDSTTISVSGTGTLILTVDGTQVASADCSTVTPEPTTEVTPPNLSFTADCTADGAVFSIINNGGDMTDLSAYTVTDGTSIILTSGSFQLVAGDSTTIVVSGTGTFILTVDGTQVASTDCSAVTPEPTAEVSPEPTTEVTPPNLSFTADCTADGAVFSIINNGGDMTDLSAYTVTDGTSIILTTGSFQLVAGDSTTIAVSGTGTFILTVDGTQVASADCSTVTPEPTVEVTPSPEPTDTVTPPPDKLGCQSNNPDRLDCSSLQVKATCDGSTALFTITNMGEPGNGDMRAPTEYRIYQDGVLVESGTVLLKGHESMQVSYTGSGTITLEVNQQTGHPGQSHPRASVNCG